MNREEILIELERIFKEVQRDEEQFCVMHNCSEDAYYPFMVGYLEGSIRNILLKNNR